MKPSYRQSDIAHYFECPKRFSLAQQFKRPSSDRMAEGNLFEGYVLGFKEGVDQKSLEKGKLKKTIESYKKIVEKVKPIFSDGDPYVSYRWESVNWILTGEADFVGNVDYFGSQVRAIADVKFTSSVSRVWIEKDSKSQYLQAAFYPFLHWKTHGEILPFIYYVVENIKDMPDVDPIIKSIRVNPTEAVFNWVESLIDSINSDLFKEPNLNACFNGSFGSRCPYLMFCSDGRRLVERPFEIDFMQLN